MAGIGATSIVFNTGVMFTLLIKQKLKIYFNAAALPQLGEVDRRARPLERARTKHFVVELLLCSIEHEIFFCL